MGSIEHPVQKHRSGWPSCATWDPYGAGDPESPLPNLRPTEGVPVSVLGLFCNPCNHLYNK